MSTKMFDLLHVLSSIRAPLTDEKLTQEEIARQLDIAGVAYDREVRLCERDIVDFLIEKTAIEVKIKGSGSAILRQLDRYSRHDSINHIVLMTSKSIIAPRTLNDKPLTVISLSRAWL